MTLLTAGNLKNRTNYNCFHTLLDSKVVLLGWGPAHAVGLRMHGALTHAPSSTSPPLVRQSKERVGTWAGPAGSIVNIVKEGLIANDDNYNSGEFHIKVV